MIFKYKDIIYYLYVFYFLSYKHVQNTYLCSKIDNFMIVIAIFKTELELWYLTFFLHNLECYNLLSWLLDYIERMTSLKYILEFLFYSWRKHYWCPKNAKYYFPYYNNNIGLFSIAPHLGIALPTFCIGFVDCFMASFLYFSLHSIRKINGSSRKAWLLITIFAIHSHFFRKGERITKVVVKTYAFLLNHLND